MKEVVKWLKEIAYLLYCIAHNEFTGRKPPISKEEYIRRVE